MRDEVSDDHEGCTLLEWDTDFFGIRIGRLGARRLSDAVLKEAGDWSAHHAVRCLYVLVEFDHDETIRLAERYGLHFVDIRVTLARTVSGESIDKRALRPYNCGDLPALLDLAGSLFVDSRFHVDSRFPLGRASALFQEWLRKSCERSEGTVLVSGSEGKPSGFVTCDPAVGGVGRIGLCGVSEGARNQGVGTRLVKAAVGWYAERGVSTVHVVTQGRNLAAQQLYQRCGFLTQSMRLWYHWWFDQSCGAEDE